MLSVAARPKRRPILKTAAALFRQGADAVLYGFLAVCWAHSLYGIAVEILTRWVYGKGSAAEAIGATVCAACWFVMVRLFPVIFPLILMRIIEHAEFVKERERRSWQAMNRFQKGMEDCTYYQKASTWPHSTCFHLYVNLCVLQV